MYKERHSALGHIVSGGGATIKDSPVNLTINIHLDFDGKMNIRESIAHAYRKRFGKSIDPTPILEHIIQRLDNERSEDRRVLREFGEAATDN